ncbi:hypothetical protein CLU79DRAFT_823145 [Phycomyces nitens]|nr:hypothetical protein CLU79DRAFT_823145 [Phycomyces nitens]
MKSIEDELNLSTYWANQAINDWNVIDYFMKLVEDEPTIDRKLATTKIMKDLELVQAALIHVPEVKSKTTTMLSVIKKKSLVISIFWEKHSSTLKMISPDHKLYVRKTQALLEEEATNISTLKREQASSSSTSTSSLSETSKKKDILIQKANKSSMTVLLCLVRIFLWQQS